MCKMAICRHQSRIRCFYIHIVYEVYIYIYIYKEIINIFKYIYAYIYLTLSKLCSGNSFPEYTDKKISVVQCRK